MVAFFGGTGGTVGTVAYGTGKSLSEALIFASTHPQYDDRLFNYIPRSNQVRTCCVKKLFDIQNNFSTQHVLPHVQKEERPTKIYLYAIQE